MSIFNKIVVEKSAVPIKTGKILEKKFNHNSKGINFKIFFNPEFLAEELRSQIFKAWDGSHWRKENPEGLKAVTALKDVYAYCVPEERIISTNLRSAELSNLAANAFQAKESPVNAMSVLCTATGADVAQVSYSVGTDWRIGPKFFNDSFGFGGSYFQEDIVNLVYICDCNDLPKVPEYWKLVFTINVCQKTRFVDCCCLYIQRRGLS